MYAYGPPKLAHTAECLDGDSCILFIAFEKPVDAVATAEADKSDAAMKPADAKPDAKPAAATEAKPATGTSTTP